MYLQATTTAVWAPQGQTPVVRLHPGREKVNFYGTLNLHTGQEDERCGHRPTPGTDFASHT
jgi:hypothetical protein